MRSLAKITLWALERHEPLINQISAADLKDCQAALPTASGTAVIKLGGKKARVFRKAVGNYHAIAVSHEADLVKSKRVMELEVEIALASGNSIEAAIQRAEGRTRRLLHNLKSLTAKTTQEVYYIAQQQRLFGVDPKDAIKYVSGEIKEHSEDAAKAFIEILKHQAAQKAEYTAFERLSGRLDHASAERHEVHKVLMNVFYLFFGDLLPKKIRVAVQPTRLQALFDYESVHVCLYYLAENAAKYIRPSSELNVSVTDDGNGYAVIRFDMESLVIKREETEKIFEEGVSGSYAVDRGLNGAGIGLHLARAMAQLNRGTLTVIAGSPAGLGSDHARNTFILALPMR